MHLSYPDIFYWLATTHLKGMGPIRIQQYLTHFADLKSLLTATSQELRSIGIKEKYVDLIHSINWKRVEQDFRWCEKNSCHLVPQSDKNYPVLLREIPDAPLLLFVRGNLNLLAEPQIAIVGSRNPTALGRDTAEQFASCLTESCLTVTSGLALGIDAASHLGALSTSGKTIAVVGTGLQYTYPASHQGLAKEILEQGAIISEFAPDTPPKPKNFPMRNRIISGLSLGVLVIEAALQSGSLITAQCANEQGREVFAIPGSIHNPLARGCHKLIRQGAKLVETAEDIMEELNISQKNSTLVPPKVLNLDTKHQHIFAQIGYDITPLDAIIVRSGLTAAEVSSMLMVLELEGYVMSVIGGYIRNHSFR